jgi:serine/threonine-protein kinase RsbW
MSRIESAVVETVTGPGTLDEIHQALDAFWLAHSGVPDEVRMRMAIAAAEIGANIIEHSGGSHGVRMRMEARALPHTVEIVFVDHGPEVSIDLPDLSFPDEMCERSRGLALAHSVLAELSYLRCGATNRWTLLSHEFR